MTYCERCKREMLPECEGRGYHFVDEEMSITASCRNLLVNDLKLRLGPHLASVPHVMNSPLYEFEGGQLKRDRTKENVLIKGTWAAVTPHMKWAVACALNHSNFLFTFRIIEDRRIRDVYVGSEAYRSRPTSKRDRIESNNSLADLMDVGVDLVVIRLGLYGYKNIAAPGSLKEALLIREVENKPTWLINDPEHPWRHSYDEDVGSYVDRRFEVFEIESGGIEAPTPDLGIVVDDEGEGEVERVEAPSECSSLCIGDLEIDLPGANQPNWKNKGKRKSRGGIL